MKKLFVLLAVLVLGCGVASAQDWGLGARLGSGFQGVAQRYFANEDHIEVRLGMDWIYEGGIVADFSTLYVFHVADMPWTDEGTWFFDAGLGLNVGGRENFATLGVQGMARLGYTFETAPISLSLDFSPALGPAIVYGGGYSQSEFNENGLANFGFSCTYRF